MTEGINWVLQSIEGGVRAALCLAVISKLLYAGRADKRRMLPGAAGGMLIAAFTFPFSASVSVLYPKALEAVWTAVCAEKQRKTDFRMGLFVSIFYEIAVALWQFLLAAGMGILSGSPEFLDQGSLAGQAADWLIYILLAAAVWKTEKGLAAFALPGFIGCIMLSEQSRLPIAEESIDMWMILSVVLLMAVLVFRMNRQYEAEKELAAVKTEQAKLLERDYTALSDAYAVNAKLFHDFHNHIGALRQLLTHQKYEEALAYLEELQVPVRNMTDRIWTGDETVDYLINSKMAAAVSKEIAMQVQVEFPRHTNLGSADLCAILGNLLDNALEAAQKVKEPEKKEISLTIRRINQMLVLKVENTCNGYFEEKDGQLQTTKQEKGLHGWGLKSARTAAEKYDGTVRTNREGNRFYAVATLSFHGVNIQ